ncbi:hypothetical protein FF1_025105 [Malus domestica]
MKVVMDGSKEWCRQRVLLLGGRGDVGVESDRGGGYGGKVDGSSDVGIDGSDSDGGWTVDVIAQVVVRQWRLGSKL